MAAHRKQPEYREMSSKNHRYPPSSGHEEEGACHGMREALARSSVAVVPGRSVEVGGHETKEASPESPGFDLLAYLLQKYGLRMTKKELEFEFKRKRATIDNMRNPRHRRFDPRLAAAEEPREGTSAGSGPVLFRTVMIAQLLGA